MKFNILFGGRLWTYFAQFKKKLVIIGSKKQKLEEGFGSVWDMDTLYLPLKAQTCQHIFSKTKNFE